MKEIKSPHAWLEAMSKSTGLGLGELLVMAGKNDPFNSGTPKDVVEARWITALHARHPTVGQHIRRLHYRAMDEQAATDVPILPNGKPYLNDHDSWEYMNRAARRARDLGYIDEDDMIDKRNADWQFGPEWVETPTIELVPSTVYMPEVLDADAVTTVWHHRPRVRGDYDPAHEPVRIAVVIEKSTANDVLEPLCERLGLDFLALKGYVSNTRVREWLLSDDRPVRLLYISDFDPAGGSMPQSFARRIEFILWRDGLDRDVAVDQVVLTPGQVKHYKIPWAPLEPLTDLTSPDPAKRAKARREEGRQKAYLARFGVPGTVELDALISRHPGVLEDLITEQVQAIRGDWAERVRHAVHAYDRQVEVVWEGHRDAVDEAQSEVQHKVDEAVEAFRSALADVWASEEYAVLTDVLAEANEAADEIEPPERPEPDEVPDADSWMFWSARSYTEQLDHYPARVDQNRDRSQS